MSDNTPKPESITLLTAILAELEAIHQLLTAAPAPAAARPAPTGQTMGNTTITVDSVSKGIDEKNKKDTYKMRGGRWQMYGVRIWPEVLQQLGIDPASLDYGPNPVNPPITVSIELTESGTPRKVIGLAK